MEEAKKQRINRLRLECEQRISAVKIAYKEYFTMDDYSTELNVEDPVDEDLWAGEDDVKFDSGVPEALWFRSPNRQNANAVTRCLGG